MLPQATVRSCDQGDVRTRSPGPSASECSGGHARPVQLDVAGQQVPPVPTWRRPAAAPRSSIRRPRRSCARAHGPGSGSRWYRCRSCRRNRTAAGEFRKSQAVSAYSACARQDSRRPLTPGFGSEQAQVLRGHEARLVFADRLRIQRQRHPPARPGPAHVEPRQLVARLVARAPGRCRCPVQQVPERTRVARTALAAPLGRCGSRRSARMAAGAISNRIPNSSASAVIAVALRADP